MNSIKTFMSVLAMAIFTLSFAQKNDTQNIENKKLEAHLIRLENERVQRVEVFKNINPDFPSNLYIHDIIDGIPITRTSDNHAAATATQTTALGVGGSLGLDLDGTGMAVGVWDAGPVQASHPEFADTSGNSRVIIEDNTAVSGDNPSSHGTHVSGTIGAKGVNSNAQGMAPNVIIRSYNWTNDNIEVLNAITSTSNPIVVSNHSYGVHINNGAGSQIPNWIMGAYDSECNSWDQVLRNNPYYLMVKSAGNEGTTGYSGGLLSGFDKLTTDSNAKNNLVVANANPQTAPFTGELISLVINPSSSQGPTDDLRIKPDIAGDGTNLYSSVPTDSYDTYSGTSMSAPNLTGSLVLLQQYYKQLHNTFMLSSTLKSLVCHTSIDDTSRPGPDPIFGWGFLNTKAAAEHITGSMSGNGKLSEEVLHEDETITINFTVNSSEPLRATICWTDLAGPTNDGILNKPDPVLINDLDLRITEGSNTYLPWKLELSGNNFVAVKGDNIVDNIEVVDIEAPTAGAYTLTVTHKGNLSGVGGGPFDEYDQPFSLILSGDLTLGVDDIEGSTQSVEIYPNPVADFLNIKSNTDLTGVEYSIFNELGQLVNQSELGLDSKVNVSTLEKGNYVLVIPQNGQNLVKKFIKK